MNIREDYVFFHVGSNLHPDIMRSVWGPMDKITVNHTVAETRFSGNRALSNEIGRLMYGGLSRPVNIAAMVLIDKEENSYAT